MDTLAFRQKQIHERLAPIIADGKPRILVMQTSVERVRAEKQPQTGSQLDFKPLTEEQFRSTLGKHGQDAYTMAMREHKEIDPATMLLFYVYLYTSDNEVLAFTSTIKRES